MCDDVKSALETTFANDASTCLTMERVRDGDGSRCCSFDRGGRSEREIVET